LLFLGSGSVIHGLSGEQDLRRMGGLKDRMPWTHRTMLVGCIAIAGIPPLAGFFSKDEVLWSAFRIGGYGRVVWAIGAVTAAMTAFYMFRLYHMTFSGGFRGTEEQSRHVHESPPAMLVPLQVLALGSIVAGFLGVPHVLGAPLGIGNAIEHFLEPAFEGARTALGETLLAHPAHGTGLELGLMGLSVAIALAAVGLAYAVFGKDAAAADARLATSLAAPHRVLLNKYYVDELYGALVVRGVALGGGQALHGMDRYVVDGGDGEVRAGLGVNGLAWLSRDIVARLSNFWDRWVVDGAVNLLAFLLDNFSYLFRALQNGLVQHYAWAMVMGVLLLIFASWFIPL
jgi:NADH-quinone oxidoreductase subunit L